MEKGGGVGCEEAGCDFDLVVEFGVGENFEAGAEGAAFGIVGGVDEAGNASLDDRAGAHGAGFEGDVKSCVGKAIVAEEAGGFADDHDFGVGGGIIVADGAIAGANEDGSRTNKQRANGDFAGFGGSAGFVESELHEIGVVSHGCRENNMGGSATRAKAQSAG